MAKRKKIVIPFLTNYNLATGVVIYLINLIKNFNLLEDSNKPFIVLLFTNESPIEEIRNINYPFIEFVQMDRRPVLLVRVINKLSYLVFRKPLISKTLKADFVFPAFEDSLFRKVKKHIFWKEDFQESYLTENFTQENLSFVKKFFESLRKNSNHALVLSSLNSGKDLRKFYGELKNPVYYLKFVSLIPPLNFNKIADLKSRFQLERSPYFIVCNQFWPHKNHSLIVKAVAQIRRTTPFDFKVVMTGKTTTSRNANYFVELNSMIIKEALSDVFCVTGFLEREDQLLLMKDSVAVIQPSLFEGWSTVIEDAKALKKYVLAADLDVNKEQIDINVAFFRRDNFDELALLMNSILDCPPTIQETNYSNDIDLFQKELVSLFEL